MAHTDAGQSGRPEAPEIASHGGGTMRSGIAKARRRISVVVLIATTLLITMSAAALADVAKLPDDGYFSDPSHTPSAPGHGGDGSWWVFGVFAVIGIVVWIAKATDA